MVIMKFIVGRTKGSVINESVIPSVDMLVLLISERSKTE